MSTTVYWPVRCVQRPIFIWAMMAWGLLSSGALELWLVPSRHVQASDHADPIDPFNQERLEGGITDLFVFPVLKDDKPAFPYQGNKSVPLHFDPKDLAREPLKPDEQAEIEALVVILCVRRALTPSDKVNLEPYTYRVHIDWDSPTIFAQSDTPEDLARAKGDLSSSGYAPSHTHDDQPQAQEMRRRPTPHEAFLRYGGLIDAPEKIEEDLLIEFRLNNEAGFQTDFPRFLRGDDMQELPGWKESVKSYSGLRDDPFIFPAFFGTNIVAMVLRIPLDLFPSRKADLLVWGTSHKGSRQVDHVGRSLRTQNPRFEFFNTLHPSEHVAAAQRQHGNPSLPQDLANRFNLGSLFAYRRWDFVPDVMIYTTRYPVGFPNGRLLNDDVAALLAQHGDTLLYELSFQHNNGSWPRETQNDRNDGKFSDAFPYLLEPTKDDHRPQPFQLSKRNRFLLVLLAIGTIALLAVENWIVAHIYYRIKSRRRYL